MSRESNAWIIQKLKDDSQITAKMGADFENLIIIAEPEDRPTLLSTDPALIVLRSEGEIPNTLNSQGGDREETIYIEARSWIKQTVHELKERIQQVLEDQAGALPSGGCIYRVRHDWNREPYKNADGVTWESQIRYIVWYR